MEEVIGSIPIRSTNKLTTYGDCSSPESAEAFSHPSAAAFRPALSSHPTSVGRRPACKYRASSCCLHDAEVPAPLYIRIYRPQVCHQRMMKVVPADLVVHNARPFERGWDMLLKPCPGRSSERRSINRSIFVSTQAAPTAREDMMI